MRKCLRIRQREQGIVVEHLFEMRHQPLLIGGVPAEAAADVIEDPAPKHMLQRTLRHGSRCAIAGQTGVPKQEYEVVRCREFGRATKSAPVCIVQSGKLLDTGFYERTTWFAGGMGLLPLELCGQRFAVAQNAGTVFPP